MMGEPEPEHEHEHGYEPEHEYGHGYASIEMTGMERNGSDGAGGGGRDEDL